jgi:hypothetical protein
MVFTYERLSRITRTAPPYRGTTNRFPLYNRRQNNKYFLSREENGQTVFDIIYGNRWENISLTKEQYDALSPAKRTHVLVNPNGTYIKYVPKRLATVYPGETKDGVLEFNAKSYSQGDRLFLSNGVEWWFCLESRKGGMVYKYRMNGKILLHPIYRGMRVNASTMRPIDPYEVMVNRVDRKASKDLMKRYDHLLKVSEVMLKSLTVDDICSTVTQLVEGIERNYGTSPEMLRKASELIDTAPLDAFLYYAMGYDLKQLKYMAYSKTVPHSWIYGVSGNGGGNAYEWLYPVTKRWLVKDLYTKNPSIFSPKVYAYGEKYPSSVWGMTLRVNGQQVEQY